MHQILATSIRGGKQIFHVCSGASGPRTLKDRVGPTSRNAYNGRLLAPEKIPSVRWLRWLALPFALLTGLAVVGAALAGFVVLLAYPNLPSIEGRFG